VTHSGNIIFIDAASTTGIADGPVGGIPALSTIQFAREHDSGPEKAWGRAVLWMAERFVFSLPVAVYIEAPLSVGTNWGHTNAKSTTMLIGLWAAISGVCEARGVPVHRANVATIRKHFIGQGNLPRDRAKRECLRIARALGWAPKTLDEADAAAGFHWACSLHDRRMAAPSAFWTAREAA
jgi:hypothetical protein